MNIEQLLLEVYRQLEGVAAASLMTREQVAEQREGASTHTSRSTTRRSSSSSRSRRSPPRWSTAPTSLASRRFSTSGAA